MTVCPVLTQCAILLGFDNVLTKHLCFYNKLWLCPYTMCYFSRIWLCWHNVLFYKVLTMCSVLTQLIFYWDFTMCWHKVCAHRVLFVAGSVTGTSPTNSLSGLASLQTLGNNNFTSVSPGVTSNGLGGSSAASGMDALSQAYSGIQQYAGLSSLLSPAGKGWWIFLFQECGRCVVLLVLRWQSSEGDRVISPL